MTLAYLSIGKTLIFGFEKPDFWLRKTLVKIAKAIYGHKSKTFIKFYCLLPINSKAKRRHRLNMLALSPKMRILTF
jgi:hypothetical protein